jgi:hypothetical protein
MSDCFEAEVFGWGRWQQWMTETIGATPTGQSFAVIQLVPQELHETRTGGGVFDHRLLFVSARQSDGFDARRRVGPTLGGAVPRRVLAIDRSLYLQYLEEGGYA